MAPNASDPCPWASVSGALLGFKLDKAHLTGSRHISVNKLQGLFLIPVTAMDTGWPGVRLPPARGGPKWG